MACRFISLAMLLVVDIKSAFVEYPSPHSQFNSLQWAYPAGWPCMHIMVVEGLQRYGYTLDAKRIAEKYLSLQLKVYELTGSLWEKYNVVEGNTNFQIERYEAPQFHGWSAASVLLMYSVCNKVCSV